MWTVLIEDWSCDYNEIWPHREMSSAPYYTLLIIINDEITFTKIMSLSGD